MADLETIVAAVRKKIGHCAPTPDAAAAAYELHLKPVSFAERPGLYGSVVVYSDTVPEPLQQYQKARAVSAHVLAYMGELHSVSVHELAVALFGVSSADAQLGREHVEYTHELVHATLSLVRGR